MEKATVRPYRDEDLSQVVEIATDLLASDKESAEIKAMGKRRR